MHGPLNVKYWISVLLLYLDTYVLSFLYMYLLLFVDRVAQLV